MSTVTTNVLLVTADLHKALEHKNLDCWLGEWRDKGSEEGCESNF